MSELDAKIIELFKEGWSYGGIQKQLGNPSKKYIKEVLKREIPDWYNNFQDTNFIKELRKPKF